VIPARWYCLVGLSALAAVALFYVSRMAEPQQRPSGAASFIPPDAKLELLVDGDREDLTFTEGVVVTCDHRILFSDMSKSTRKSHKSGKHGARRASGILEYHPATRSISVFRSPSNGANGNRIDPDCNLLTAEHHQLVRTDLATGRAEIVISSDDGKSYQGLNDIAFDSLGRIYVTHPRYLPGLGTDQDVGVYRIDPDGTVTRIISDAAKPNGIAICPDEQHIYVASYDFQARSDREMAILQYDLGSDGSAANRSVLIDYSPEHGPDGLVCDREGNLWVAVRDERRPGIYAYSVQDGVAQEQAYIPTPQRPTNLHFGRGDQSSYLYITAGNSLYGIRVGKQGDHLQ
jgi:gluconolactonase